MRRLGSVLLWILAAVLGAGESALVYLWASGTLYVMQYGAAENPYDAENAEIAGICAVLLLPLFLMALAAAVWSVWSKKREDSRRKR